MSRALVFGIAVVLIFTVSSGSALAQYYFEEPNGLKFEPVVSGQELAIVSPHPLVLAAQEESGLVIDGMFKIEDGMQRFFTMEYNQDAEEELFTEYVIVSKTVTNNPPPEPVGYWFSDAEIMIGLGYDESEDWSPFTIVSYLAYFDGTVEELARYECGARYCGGVYALDMIGDGVVEIVASWATGAGAGGGIDILAVVPTGGLATFTDDEDLGGFYSAHGATTITDYDGDGDMEFTISYPLFYSAAGFYYTELYTFDWDSFSWIDGYEVAPWIYEEQNKFYKELATHVKRFKTHPEEYRLLGEVDEWWGWFGVEIDGEMRYLDMFVEDQNGVVIEEMVDEFLDIVSTMK